MEKRFIVLIDLGEHAAALLRYAYEWSQLANARLLLLHQTNILVPGLSHAEYKKTITSDGNEEALHELEALVQQTLPAEAVVQYRVSGTHLLEQLEELLAEPFEQMIFAGAKTTGFIKRLFLGTKTVDIIEHTNTTLVVMPSDFASFTHRHLWVAVAEKHAFNTDSFRQLLSLFPKTETRITFFSIAQKNENIFPIEQYLQTLSNQFSSTHTSSIAIYEGSDTASDVQMIIQHPQQEILVMQKGTRDLTDIFFRKLLVNEVVYDGRTPVIVLP